MTFGGKPKSITPQKLPEPVAQTRTITVEAQKAGRTERRRLGGYRGKAGTIFTRAGGLGQATTEKAALKQRFG